MIRVRCDALPIIDPTEDARRIVWEGFSQAYSDFEHWHTSTEPPWPYDGAMMPKLTDMLVGETITLASPEADDWLTAVDKYGAWPQRIILGIDPGETTLDTLALAVGDRLWVLPE